MSESKQILAEHLKALRKVLIVSICAVVAAFFVLFYFFSNTLVGYILLPLKQRSIDIIYTAVSEALMMQFKSCLVAAVVVAMPVIVWQIWLFIRPALFPEEKRVFSLLFFVAALLFFLGVVFSYFTVFPLAIDLFIEAGQDLALPLWSINEYFNFTLSFVLPFGLMFELPVAIYMLARRGKITYRQMAKNRKYMILGIAVVAGFLTPPDVVSQIMLGLPMWVLYEIGAQVARLVKVKEKAVQA